MNNNNTIIINDGVSTIDIVFQSLGLAMISWSSFVQMIKKQRLSQNFHLLPPFYAASFLIISIFAKLFPKVWPKGKSLNKTSILSSLVALLSENLFDMYISETKMNEERKIAYVNTMKENLERAKTFEGIGQYNTYANDPFDTSEVEEFDTASLEEVDLKATIDSSVEKVVNKAIPLIGEKKEDLSKLFKQDAGETIYKVEVDATVVGSSDTHEDLITFPEAAEEVALSVSEGFNPTFANLTDEDTSSLSRKIQETVLVPETAKSLSKGLDLGETFQEQVETGLKLDSKIPINGADAKFFKKASESMNGGFTAGNDWASVPDTNAASESSEGYVLGYSETEAATTTSSSSD